MKIISATLLSIVLFQISIAQNSNNEEIISTISTRDSITPMIIENLVLTPEIILPEDSLECVSLLVALSGFLTFAEQNVENKWVLPTETIETQLLIDEIENIQKSKQYGIDHFYKPYVTNIIPIDEHDYIIKVSYIGIFNNYPIVRANLELNAYKKESQFFIASPLKRNTRNWNTTKIENHYFFHPYAIDEKEAFRFTEKAIFYDNKLNNNNGQFHYYLEKRGFDALKLFGIEYKSDYNGYELNSRWHAEDEQVCIWVANEDRVFGYDTHDLWHNRLRRIIPRNKIHRRVDCYIATLYGGMWGESWDVLFPKFCKNFVLNKTTDWLDQKSSFESHIPVNGRKVYVDDFVGALLVQKIEKEKGFEGVWELLKTKRTKEDLQYFAVLERLVGINQQNYNQEVNKLIELEMVSQEIL